MHKHIFVFPPSWTPPTFLSLSYTHTTNLHPYILVSCCLFKKLTNFLSWLNVIQSYLVVLEATSLRCIRRTACLDILGEALFPCLSHFLQPTCIPWLIVPSSTFIAHSVSSSNISVSLTCKASVATSPSLTLFVSSLYLLWAQLSIPSRRPW